MVEFKGDISEFSVTQVGFVKSVLIKHGFSGKTVLVEPVGKKGDNYNSTVKRIVVETNDAPFKMIAKVATSNELLRNMLNVVNNFTNEMMIYNEIFPKFKELFDSENIPDIDRLNIPTCYGIESISPNEIILLEDLQASNYVLLDKFKPFDDETMKLVLKNLAILHSLSYVMKNKYIEMYEGVAGKLKNPMGFLQDSDMIKMWLFQMAADLLPIFDDDKYKKIISEALNQLPLALANLGKNLDSNNSLIVQGDCWTNNILFKLEDGKPVDAIMIDYQQSRIDNPVTDFLYLTLNCTDHDTRLKHYYQWIDYYHLQLKRSLENFGLNIISVYPRDQLDADLRRYGKVGVVLGILLTNAMVVGPDDLPDSGNQKVIEMPKISNYSKATIARLKLKIEGCIDSAIEFGLI